MADTVTPEVRSRVMSAIKGKDTAPEMQIRRGLHAMGFRYGLHSRRFPGKPDMILPKYKAVIWITAATGMGTNAARAACPRAMRAIGSRRLSATKNAMARTRQQSKQRDGVAWWFGNAAYAGLALSA